MTPMIWGLQNLQMPLWNPLTLLEAGNDLVLAGEFGLEVGVFGLHASELFLKLAEAVEELLDVGWGAVFPCKRSSKWRA